MKTAAQVARDARKRRKLKAHRRAEKMSEVSVPVMERFVFHVTVYGMNGPCVKDNLDEKIPDWFWHEDGLEFLRDYTSEIWNPEEAKAQAKAEFCEAYGVKPNDCVARLIWYDDYFDRLERWM